MAYLILSDRQGEFDRRELTGPAVVGRALDCDVCVRDILLSRKHCRIEPFDGRWVISDLGSKNGTRIGSEVITRHVLDDGDVIRIGKIQVCFRAGAFVPAPKGVPRRNEARPADPKEALSGTVLGFQLFDMEEDSRVSGFPIPKPKPPEPPSFRQESVTSMVTQMASTSWDVALSEGQKAGKGSATRSPKQPAAAAKRAPVAARKTAPPAPPATVQTEPVKTPRRAPLIRSQSPDRAATIPTWLACTYIVLAAAVGVASVGVIVLRSNPSLNWLAR